LRAVVLDEHEEGAAAGGKTRAADVAIEFQSEDFFFAAGGGGDGEMMRGVVDGFGVDLAGEDDPFAVGGPGGRAVGAGIGGDLGEVRAFVIWRGARRAGDIVGGDGPDVGIEIAVGVGLAAVAREG
jgi:hypothetical protein